jgi:hypothetical protein
MLVAALSKPNRTYQTITPKRAVETVWPFIEAELQKHAEEKARLVGEFRRLAAKAKEIADSAPKDSPDIWRQTSHIWNRAAQMLEESKHFPRPTTIRSEVTYGMDLEKAKYFLDEESKP